MSLRSPTRLLLLSFLLYSCVVVVYVLHVYDETHARVIAEVDQRLRYAATGVRSILGNDFHDRITSKEHLSPHVYNDYSRRLSDFATSIDVAYIYSMILDNGDVRFTSSSYTINDIRSGQLTQFFDKYPEATEANIAAFHTVRPIYEESEDKWGRFRSILFPMISNDGTIYIAGADIRKEEIDSRLYDRMMQAAKTAVVFLISVILITVILIYGLRRNRASDTISMTYSHGALSRDLKSDSALHKQLAILTVAPIGEIINFYGINIADEVMTRFLDRIEIHFGADYHLYRLTYNKVALLHSGGITDSLLIERFKQLDFHAPFLTSPDVYITVMMGVASGNKELLFENASIAAKAAKNSRQNIAVYTDKLFHMKSMEQQHVRLYSDIREAFVDDRVVTYFQPVVDLNTLEIVRYECLARVICKDGTILCPEQFLPVVKYSRLEGELTRIILTRAAEQFRYSSMGWSINITIADMLDSDLTTYMKNFLLDYPEPSRVVLELMESQTLDQFEDVKRFLQLMNTFDVRVMIDDFGVGYTNISNSLKLNLDGIKLFGPLIQRMTRDKQVEVFIKHLSAFARESQLKVTAKCIENKHTATMLRDMGIELGQGHLFGAPTPTPAGIESRVKDSLIAAMNRQTFIPQS